MTGEHPPARWNPEARGGAGGWVTADGTATTADTWEPQTRPAEGGARPHGKTVAAALCLAGLLAAAGLVGYQLAGGGAGPAEVDGEQSALTTGDGTTGGAAGTAAPPDAPEPAGPDPEGDTADADADLSSVLTDIDGMLDTSSSARAEVVAAVTAVSGCDQSHGIEAAEATLTQAAAQRESAVGTLNQMDLTAWPDLRTAVAVLRRAWTESAEADRAFAAWAAVHRGCEAGATVPLDGSYGDGKAASDRATAEKQDFVLRWNAIAADHGLALRKAGGL